MKITCPQCAFERLVADDRLPSASVIATCPQCGCKFRVQRPQKMEESASSPQASPASPLSQTPPVAQEPPASISRPERGEHEDDPLPPGAVIPGRDTEAPQRPPMQQEQREQREQAKPAADLSDAEAEERELRRAAAAAYEKQAEEGGSAFALENPWEHPERDGYLAAFYQTTVRVMFAAPRFFAGLCPETPQVRAMLFYLVVSVLQICIERFWGGVLSSVLAPTAGNDPQLQKLLQLLSPETNIILAIFMRVALVTMEIFIAAGLYFLVFKLLAPSKANYSLIFQVLAYSVAPSLLCIVPVAGSVTGFIWSMACSFIGCRYTMGLTWTQTALGLVPLYILGIPIILQVVHSLQSMAG